MLRSTLIAIVLLSSILVNNISAQLSPVKADSLMEQLHNSDAQMIERLTQHTRYFYTGTGEVKTNYQSGSTDEHKLVVAGTVEISREDWDAAFSAPTAKVRTFAPKINIVFKNRKAKRLYKKTIKTSCSSMKKKLETLVNVTCNKWGSVSLLTLEELITHL